MGHLDYTNFARRHRPHIHPLGAVLFLTFRLAGSIPQSTLRAYKAKGKWLREEICRVSNLESPDERLVQEQQKRLEDYSREWFLKFEEILHKAKFGPTWLKDEGVAQKVSDNFHRLHGEALRLDAFSIMSNHVHAVFKPLLSADELIETIDPNGGLVLSGEHPSLARIMQSIKGRSSRECNLVLGRSGQFWEHENFDRVVRVDDFDRTVRYVLKNPVKAGLVENWREWRWNYLRKELEERF